MVLIDQSFVTKNVRVTLRPDLQTVQSFEGDVFAVQEISSNHSGFLVLRKTKHHTWQKADYYIISTENIAEIVVIGDGEPLPDLREFDAETLQKRFNSTAKREEERIARQGKGVGEIGQNIFDRLARNFPGLVWSGKTIIIADRIELREPYTRSTISYCDNVDDNEKEALRKIMVRLEEALSSVRLSLNLPL
jgi:hypothetical protein